MQRTWAWPDGKLADLFVAFKVGSCADGWPKLGTGQKGWEGHEELSRCYSKKM